MAERCKGECKKQEYEVRGVSLTSVTADAGNPAGCATPSQVEKSDEVRNALLRLEMELREPQWILKCEGDPQCGCSLQDTPWGDWLGGLARKPLTLAGCKYTITCLYEIRGRVRPGACVNVVYRSFALGIVPERNLTVELADVDFIEPDRLEKIKDILT